MKKRITLILALLTATGALIGVFAATSAAAATTVRAAPRPSAATSVSGDTNRATRFSTPVFFLENKHTALCVDDSARFGLRAIRCNLTDHQKWYMIYKGGIIYTWKNVRTGRCIDDSTRGLRALTCNGRDFQKWQVLPAGNGFFYLHNVHTGLCMDDSSRFGLRAARCDHLDFQQWQ